MKPKNKLTKYDLLAESEFGKTKRIHIWINGESRYYPVTINPKDFRSWPPILAHLTNLVQPNFGMVKRLVAVSTMQSVHDFDELDSKEKYIAVGAQSKVKIPPRGFEVATDRKTNPQKSVRKFYLGELNPKSIPFLEAMKKRKLTVIYTAISGNTRPPQKVIFNEQDMKDWNLIRNYLAKLLGIADGVQNICTIYGETLYDANQFQHGYLYVVVPFTQQFVQMDYASLSGEKYNYRRNFMPPVQPAFNANSFTRARGLEKNRSASLRSINYEDEKLRPKESTVSEEYQEEEEEEEEEVEVPEKHPKPTQEENIILEDGTTNEIISKPIKGLVKNSSASLRSINYEDEQLRPEESTVSEEYQEEEEEQEEEPEKHSKPLKEENIILEDDTTNKIISKPIKGETINYDYLWKNIEDTLLCLKYKIDESRLKREN